MRIAEIVVLFITALLVILLVARPLVQGAIGNVSGSRRARARGRRRRYAR
jgi:flagellar M-ring protein FliF